MKRILLALITMNDSIYTDTVRSLLDLDKTGLQVDYAWFSHSITSAARNCAAARCMGEGYDYLFFLDLDMTIHPQTLRRLVSHDVPVVSGMYRARRGDVSPFFAFNFREDGMPQTVIEIDMNGPELLKVDGLPTGCMLIRRDVFEKLDDHARQQGHNDVAPGQPYFYYESRLDRLIKEREKHLCETAVKHGHVDEDVLRYKPAFGRGEDLRFCVSCKEAGIPLYLDTRVVAGHLALKNMGVPAIYE